MARAPLADTLGPDKLAHSQWVSCHRDVSGFWGLPATVTLPPSDQP